MADMPQSPVTVVRRRRGGEVVHQVTIRADGSLRHEEQLEAGMKHRDAGARLRHALTRVRSAMVEGTLAMSTKELRSEQQAILDAFAQYLELAVDESGRALPWARVIAPPRIGKTVVMGGFIAATQATAVVVVPTMTLVEQTVRELRAQLPTVGIGAYYGDEKSPRLHGVTVMTYAILQHHHRTGQLPAAVRRATFVLCDEGHKAMTSRRQAVLRKVFEPCAVRIAFTATPDYDQERTLATFFPHLIHEITMKEAVELNRLASAVVEIHAIDVDGSVVTLKAQEFDQDALGHVMGEAPFFEAARVIRYGLEDNARIPALMCCVSRQQATELQAYLSQRAPDGAPKPGLVLHDTPAGERKALLERFEQGTLDTLIQVGVLIEGWNSPRCKLLVDLAPTLSWVRAKQKFFRVMTKRDDELAKIYMLLPWGLPELPIVPQELFGESIGVIDPDGWLALWDSARRRRVCPSDLSVVDQSPIRRVEVKSQILRVDALKCLKLDARDKRQVRSVISQKVPDPSWRLPSMGEFCQLSFDHPRFTGSGERLMRLCGVHRIYRAYVRWMLDLFPGLGSHELALLAKTRVGVVLHSEFDGELLRLERDPRQREWTDEQTVGYAKYWRAYWPPDSVDPEQALVAKRMAAVLEDALKRLSPRYEEVLVKRYGLFGEAPHTHGQIAQTFGITAGRVQQIEAKALARLIRTLRHQLGGEAGDASDPRLTERILARVPALYNSRRKA